MSLLQREYSLEGLVAEALLQPKNLLKFDEGRASSIIFRLYLCDLIREQLQYDKREVYSGALLPNDSVSYY